MPERAASAHDPLHDSLPIARTRETGRRSSWRLALLVLAGAVAVSVGWAAAPRSAAAAPAWSAPASPSTDCADYEDYLQWRWTGGVDTPGLAWDVAAYGQYAYVADHSEGMQVLDISDPQHPTIVRQVSLQIVTLGVAVSGEYLYLVGHEPGFVVMSLTDPANPALVGQAETPHSCHGIDVAGDHAYIAVDWDTESLLILDISTKTNPRIVASLGAASSANDVTVSGGYAYLACIETGLAVIDVGDPENPELVTTVDTRVDPELPVAAYGIVVSGSLAYVADYSGLVVIDVTDPQAPGIVGRLTIPSHGGHSVALSGDRAFVSSYEYPGVMIADVTDPANPAVEEMLKIRGRPSGIALAGSALLVSDDALGVQVVEMTNPDAEDPIEALGQVALAGDVLDLAEAGGVAYAADASSFSSVDVTNPQSPVVLDSWTPMRYVMAIEVVGDRAYVADGDVLTVLDVSDPGNLELLGRSAETYWDMTDVAVSGSYVYATLEPHGWVYVFDVSDPSQPGIVGDVQVGYEPRSIAVSGSYAFVAEHSTGLVNLDVVDISDPRAPQWVAVLPLGTQTTFDAKVAVQRTRVYVAAASGFYIVDVSSPRRPRLVGTGDRPYGYGSISILGNRAALGFAGFDVADMSDPENPRVIGGRSLSSGSDEVLLTNDYIFASQRTEDGSLLQLYPAACDPTPPLPITPFNLLVPVSEDSFLTTEPLMRWESAHAADPADSVRYTLFWSTDSLFATADSVDTGTRATYTFPAGTLSLFNTYYWRVRARTASAEQWCDPPQGWSFIVTDIDTAVLVAPQAISQNDGILLTWRASETVDLTGFRVLRRGAGEGEWRDVSSVLPASEESSYLDAGAEPGMRYEYVIEALGPGGVIERYGPVSAMRQPPAGLSLRVRPNPTAGELILRLALPAPADEVRVRVLDVQGRQVALWSERDVRAGIQERAWKPKDSAGRPLATGTYWFRVESPEGRATVPVRIVR